MMLAFTLSMPGCPSWNGKWSGEGKKYVIVNTFRAGSDAKNAAEIMLKRSFSYRWDDGWVARIDVHEVNSAQAAKLRKESNGFCGYEWMVKSIVQHGVILANHQIEEFLKKKLELEVAQQADTPAFDYVIKEDGVVIQSFDQDDNFYF
jgi:hypothetical protein